MLDKAEDIELAVLVKPVELVVLATAVPLFEMVVGTPLAMLDVIEMNDELGAVALLLLALMEENMLLATEPSRVG